MVWCCSPGSAPVLTGLPPAGDSPLPTCAQVKLGSRTHATATEPLPLESPTWRRDGACRAREASMAARAGVGVVGSGCGAVGLQPSAGSTPGAGDSDAMRTWGSVSRYGRIRTAGFSHYVSAPKYRTEAHRTSK